MQVKAENEEYHTEFQCTNKNFRYQKDVDCPNACGAVMMIRDVLTHLSYACPRRMVECTLNCGNTVQLDRLAGTVVESNIHIFFLKSLFNVHAALLCFPRQLT